MTAEMHDSAMIDWLADNEDAWPDFRRAMDPDGFGFGCISFREFVTELMRIDDLRFAELRSAPPLTGTPNE